MAKTFSICMLPHHKTTGGPSSFQAKLKTSLSELGIDVHYDITRKDTRTLLITGATRDVGALLEARRRKIRIVQRLDGMNWLHKHTTTGIKHYIRSERMNLQLALIRRWFADAIVYQSNFTEDWWSRTYGVLKKDHVVIYNGVDLAEFIPGNPATLEAKVIRILVVEGSFKGGHQRDLYNAIEFADGLSTSLNRSVELAIAGNVPQDLKNRALPGKNVSINWLGVIPHNQIPDLDRSAHLFFPAEINAACPNSVVEALASGLPVVGYATGAISELVGNNGGAAVSYGSDYWKLEAPEGDTLVKESVRILEDLPKYQRSARERAEEYFGLDRMVRAYLQILDGA